MKITSLGYLKTEAGVTGLSIPYEIPNKAKNRAQKELASSSLTHSRTRNVSKQMMVSYSARL